MTNRERMLRVLNNEEVDRVPVGFWFHFLGEDRLADGARRPDLIERNIAGHKKYFEDFPPDFVKIMSDGFIKYPVDGPVEGPEGLARVKAVTGDHPWARAQIDMIRRIVALRKDTMFFYNLFSPSTSLRIVIGRSTLMDYFQANPVLVVEALNRMAEGLAVLAECIIREGGVDGVYYCVQNPDRNRMTDAEYTAHVKPADMVVLGAANAAGENNILHVCGYEGAKNNLDAWVDYEAKVYNWASHLENVGLAEGKRLFGGKAVIGGFDHVPGTLLYTGGKDEIQAHTRALLAETGRKGVAVGADCSLTPDFPVERLEWVRQAAE